MNKTTIKAYAQIIHAAAMNRRAALQTELAVGFAVLLDSYPSKRLARAQLQKIYDDAGCKCSGPHDVNWKSINRRIAASSALFDFMGADEVRGWAGDLQKAPLIDAIVKKLEPLKLNTVNEVLIVCKGQKTVGGESGGAGRKPGLRIETSHLKFSIPPATTPEELLEVAGKLMSMAQELVNARQEEAATAAAEMAATNGNGHEHVEHKEKLAA
jgi:2-keto-4-pentenoate hydratase